MREDSASTFIISIMSIYREIGYPSFGILLSPIIAAAAMAFAICSLSQAGNAVFQGFLAMRKWRTGPKN
jgi:hypothetical protein